MMSNHSEQDKNSVFINVFEWEACTLFFLVLIFFYSSPPRHHSLLNIFEGLRDQYRVLSAQTHFPHLYSQKLHSSVSSLIVLLHFTSCPTFDDVTATLMGVRDWLTHHRYHRRHRCPTFDDVTATLMGVRDDVMTGNHYKVQKDYYLANGPCVHYVMVSKFNGSHFGLPPSSIHRMTSWVGISCEPGHICTGPIHEPRFQKKKKKKEVLKIPVCTSSAFHLSLE